MAIAVLLVIGVTIGATLLFTRGDGDTPSAPSTSGAPSDIASAGDTGPVSIITEDQTCKALEGINSVLADVEANGWSDMRASLGPASTWTPQQRETVQAVATAMRNGSDQMASLARQTPHRVMRELYEQFGAYGRAYADSIPTYDPADNFLADVNVNIGSAMLGICNAIEYRSALRSVALSPAAPPTDVAVGGDPANPRQFLATSNPVCPAWVARERAFIADTAAWGALDPNVAAAQWTPQQRTVQLGVLPTLTTMADDMESAGRQSGNPVMEDFAVLATLYFRAYVSTGENYVGADSWLSYVGLRLNNSVAAACEAAAKG